MTHAAVSTEHSQPPDAQWVHRSAAGLEFGGETPKGEIETGPQALVSAIKLAWTVRDTLYVLVAKDFKSRYRAQSLGLFWSLAQPLVMMATLTVAFEWVLHVQIENFPVFYLIGAIFWQLFNNVLTSTTSSMLDNGGLIKHTTFPRFLFPVSTVFSNLIPFGMEMLLVFAFFAVFPAAYNLNGTILALPFFVLLLVVLCIGVGLMTSALNARYRDVYYFVTSVLTVGFWGTPVLYSTEMAPGWLRMFLRLNPIGCVIESSRSIIMEGRLPPAPYVAVATAESLVVFLLGAALFRRHGRRVADYV